ncbi:MAG: KTSC domain-containing protein [Chthonomonas sp.]|nr:KTSC domain-containing protein [Chthonomonas sp.]
MKNVRMIPIEGSHVCAIGYSRSTQTLIVEFGGGRTYGYDMVPEAVFMELYESPNVGGFVAERIKGVYRYQEIFEVRNQERGECLACEGSGEIGGPECGTCAGTGRGAA